MLQQACEAVAGVRVAFGSLADRDGSLSMNDAATSREILISYLRGEKVSVVAASPDTEQPNKEPLLVNIRTLRDYFPTSFRPTPVFFCNFNLFREAQSLRPPVGLFLPGH